MSLDDLYKRIIKEMSEEFECFGADGEEIEGLMTLIDIAFDEYEKANNLKKG